MQTFERELEAENERLRAALEPFARIGRSMNGRAATPADMEVMVTMGRCRAALGE